MPNTLLRESETLIRETEEWLRESESRIKAESGLSEEMQPQEAAKLTSADSTMDTSLARTMGASLTQISPSPMPSELNKNPGSEQLGEKLARATATGAGIAIMAVLAAVAIFLLCQGVPAIWANSTDLPFNAENLWSLAGPLLFGSLWASALALLLAIPVGVGAALFITHYAPRVLRGPLAGILDLLAAIPSVVYGLWGLMILAPMLAQFYGWLAEHADWIWLFSGTPSASGRTILTAAIVLAIMILPILASVCREVFALTPVLSIEAALALGATKWEMIRLAVFPFARSGIVSASMLGLGRALGETMAVAMVLSPTPFLVTFKLIESSNPNTIAAMIAQTFPEAQGMEVSALIGLGLLLFVITFLVNAVARRLVRS